MSIFGRILGRRKADAAKTSTHSAKAPSSPMNVSAQDDGRKRTVSVVQDQVKTEEQAKIEASLLESISSVHDKVASTVSAPADDAAVNIWDLDNEDSAGDISALATPDPAPAPSPARRRRNKTRLLGFDTSDDSSADKASGLPDPEAMAGSATPEIKFPVGWVLVVSGPGRGTSFSLIAGMSQIGRGDDQAVSLNFGDNTISRTNHAAIVYDPETHKFLLGHGGKNNIVRLNGDPIISNEAMSDGDEIRIGATTLRFVALCGDDFNWSQDDASEDDDNVEIA